MSKQQHRAAAADDDDEAVVFNPNAYSVVSAWISKSAITEEDEALPKHKKPLYSQSKPQTDEDKFLASKLLKKKRDDTTQKAAVEADDDEDETFRSKGTQAKKQKTLSVQEQLLQSLRMQQERRNQKNQKKKNKSKGSKK
ncbi:Aste57867_10428 [Aphanomyces stellatus]|uniref:Aste57867_10428 protein n=1 Tax=Aphanomyces stellatus TaxID=120398 RepID=A0A485KQB3_9STRA|nr:hypothetical protein As57867_010388 [Aphanomyces stellatus]VFT87302.1 Aste57867_10428 [Aphanomyces stellatus]